MKTRTCAVGVLLLAAALAVVWRAGVPAPATVAPRDAGHSGAAASAPAAAEWQVQPTGDASATGRSAAGERSAARAVRITTVGRDGEPIGGAEVRYWPVRSQQERERDDALYASMNDPEARLRAGGRVATTDARGIVEIEGEEGQEVCARSGELYAQGNLGDARDAFADELRLELQRDVTLRIEVVDTDGRPLAGRRVHVDTHCVSLQRGITKGNESIGPTDANGLIVLPHALVSLGSDPAAAHGRIGFEVRRSFDNRGGPLAEHEMGWDQLRPVTEVRLVLPTGGVIVVSATDADGGAMTPSCWLEDEKGDTFATAWLDEGRLWFRDVPLGRSWAVRASIGNVEHRVAVAGPRIAGEVVPLDLRLPVHRFELHARVTRRDGAPLAMTDVTALGAGTSTDGSHFLTMDDGTIPFGIWYEPAAIDNLAPIELDISGSWCAPGRFVVHRAIAPGITDLGTFVVGPPAGETLLARVELRTEGEPVGDRGWAGLQVGKGWAQKVVCPPGRTRDGIVELRGVIPQEPMLLWCSATDCAGARNIPVRPGEHRVIEMPRAAALRVAMLVPDVPRGEIRATLTAIGDEHAEEGFDAEQQVAVFHGVAPGRYRLRVLAGAFVLHDEPEITLHPGNNRWPADGSRLDLRDRVRTRCLVARDAVTQELISVEAIQVSAGAAVLPAEDEQYVRNSWFVLRPQATDLLVRAEDYVPVRVSNPTGDVLLHLQPSTDMWLRVVAEDDAKVLVRIVDDAVQDPLLRAFDRYNVHTPAQEFAVGDARNLRFAPGTIVEFTLLRGGKAGPPQRVVIGTEDGQEVQLR